MYAFKGRGAVLTTGICITFNIDCSNKHQRMQAHSKLFVSFGFHVLPFYLTITCSEQRVCALRIYQRLRPEGRNTWMSVCRFSDVVRRWYLRQYKDLCQRNQFYPPPPPGMS